MAPGCYDPVANGRGRSGILPGGLPRRTGHVAPAPRRTVRDPPEPPTPTVGGRRRPRGRPLRPDRTRGRRDVPRRHRPPAAAGRAGGPLPQREGEEHRLAGARPGPVPPAADRRAGEGGRLVEAVRLRDRAADLRPGRRRTGPAHPGRAGGRAEVREGPAPRRPGRAGRPGRAPAAGLPPRGRGQPLGRPRRVGPGAGRARPARPRRRRPGPGRHPGAGRRPRPRPGGRAGQDRPPGRPRAARRGPDLPGRDTEDRHRGGPARLDADDGRARRRPRARPDRRQGDPPGAAGEARHGRVRGPDRRLLRGAGEAAGGRRDADGLHAGAPRRRGGRAGVVDLQAARVRPDAAGDARVRPAGPRLPPREGPRPAAGDPGRRRGAAVRDGRPGGGRGRLPRRRGGPARLRPGRAARTGVRGLLARLVRRPRDGPDGPDAAAGRAGRGPRPPGRPAPPGPPPRATPWRSRSPRPGCSASTSRGTSTSRWRWRRAATAAPWTRSARSSNPGGRPSRS